MKDLIITLPKKIKWVDYQKELKDVVEKNLELNFKVPFLPKDVEFGKTKVFITHEGVVKGYMFLTGIKKNQQFSCETTGLHWNGNFLVRTGEFYPVDPVKYKGFQGFRYFDFDKEFDRQFMEKGCHKCHEWTGPIHSSGCDQCNDPKCAWFIPDQKIVLAISKRLFDDIMKQENITLDNIEEKSKTCFISINESIQDCDAVKPYFSEDRSNLKVIYTDDIDEDVEHKHSKLGDITLKSFSEEQAKDLFEFIKKNSDKKYFYVHCAAGVSRSGAVATFISDYFRCSYERFRMDNKHIHPNGKILAELNKVARND